MNSREYKRVSITCPKCKTMYSIDEQGLRTRKRELQELLGILRAKMAAFRNEHPSKNAQNKHPYYKKLKRQYAETEVQLKQVKNDISNLSDISKRELFEAFKIALYNKYGKDEIIKILLECEDDLRMNSVYDTAKQTHTNFEGV